jgi:SBP domain
VRNLRGLAPLLTLALAAAAAATGCGSGSSATTTHTSAPAATATAATPTTTTVAKPAEPKGRLSGPEYRALVRFDKEGNRDAKLKGQKFVHAYARICSEAASAPQTTLFRLQVRACRRGVRFFGALIAFDVQKLECRKALAAGDVSCFGELYSRLARATRPVLASSRAINAELARRGLTGNCAKAIGRSSARELEQARTIGRSARLASQALYARSEAHYLAANAKLAAAFKALGHGSDDKTTTKRLRHCPHD